MEVAKKSWRMEQGHHVRVSRLLLHKGYTRLESADKAGADPDYLHWKRPNAAVSLLPIAVKQQQQQQEQQQEQQQQQQQQQRRKWRFKIRPKVRVLCSTISRLVRRLRDSYARVMLVLASKARDSSLLPLVYKKKPAIGHASPKGRGGAAARHLSDVEIKYLNYIKRSVADGELAYYTMALRNTNVL